MNEKCHPTNLIFMKLFVFIDRISTFGEKLKKSFYAPIPNKIKIFININTFLMNKLIKFNNKLHNY